MIKVKYIQSRIADVRKPEQFPDVQINKFIEENPGIEIKDIVYGGTVNDPTGNVRLTLSSFFILYDDSNKIEK